ncbi:hypothetical protein FK220_002110 [Flavobacteriaceae bacterium TP-CH-4]|uniref:Uncharacterized protein n=1 Tax=Pelagihabitans pacificus TaxID=2696054 RepID=A0A967APT8_9FLAO|nr:hypothetical protein [Pelagihabitans pacificus]NHF58118.1 hypothetical protein [Pelagihabitans pacificus]
MDELEEILYVHDSTKDDGKLCDRFSIAVYPHGIINSDGQVYALFKAVITSIPLLNEKKNNKEIKNDIVNSINYINRLKFSYNKDSIKSNLLLEIKNAENCNDLRGLEPISFLYPNGSEGRSFNFGGDKEGNKILKIVDDCFIQRDKASINNKAAQKKINFVQLKTTQFGMNLTQGVSNKAASKSNNKSIIRQTLDKSSDFAVEIGDNKYSLRNQGVFNSNFTALYSELLDNHFIAEHYYGLIRAFRIPINVFMTENSSYQNLYYDIAISQINNNESNSNNLQISLLSDIKPFRLRKSTNKYYNGLRDYVIHENSVLFKENWYKPANGQDSAISVSFNDPYHSELDEDTNNDTTLSRDGIYVLVTYQTKDNKILDPIGECKWVSGFNVVSFGKSLSLHKIEYQMKDNEKSYFENYTSGRMISESDIIIDQETAVRSNILFAFKGENLIANRKPKQIENSENEHNNKLDLVSQSQIEDEIICKQFEKKISFIKGGNKPLLINYPQRFYLRTTTPAGYYLETEQELELDVDKGLKSSATVSNYWEFNDLLSNDHMSNPNGFREIPGPFVDTAFPAPDTNSLIVIGNEDYRDSKKNENMDGPTHMVLDGTKNEKAEIRYIYPPYISFFNFRVLGNLTKDKLKKKNNEILTISKFVDRWLELERRSKLDPKKIQDRNLRIGYLADLRSDFIFISPFDLKTANCFAKHNLIDIFYSGNKSGFNLKENYPFYNSAKGTKLELRKRRNKVELIYNGNVLLPEIEAGSFRFNWRANNSKANLELRFSNVDYPRIPQQNEIFPVYRSTKHSYFWSLDFNVTEQDPARKSLKYIEETDVLRLFQNDLEKSYRKYLKTIIEHPKPLLDNEFPYDMFLWKEGNIETKTDLRTNIYHQTIAIDISLQPITLNKIDQSILAVKLSDEDSIELSSKDNKFIWRLKDKSDVLFQSEEPSFQITSVFDPYKLEYCLKINELDVIELNKSPYQDFCYDNIIVNDKLKVHTDAAIPEEVNGIAYYSEMISLNDAILKLNFTNNRALIAREVHPYYRKKRIKLFSSSIFQPFFQDKTEIEIGRFAKQPFEIEIPNNVKPEPPIFDADVLFMKDMDLLWRNDESSKIKEISNQQLLRITLSQDFMKEGPNLLGLVLDKSPQYGSVKGEDFSTLGEDITKLSSENWQKNEIEEYLNLGKTPGIPLIPEIKKYLEFEEDAKFSRKNIINSDELKLIDSYLIDGSIYKVLHLNPYYNANDGKWQIILAFKNIGRIETFFARLILTKVAKGHGLKRENNLLVDSTDTNLSQFTKPAFIPIYSIKSFKIENLKDNKISIQINPERAFDKSVYQNKLYVLMGSKFKRRKSVFNIREIGHPELNDFVNLLTFPVIDGQTPNKVIAYKPSPSPDFKIILSDKGIKKLFIFEFELHDNSKKELLEMKIGTAKYLNFNPLFGTSEGKEGLRLINYVQFKL